MTKSLAINANPKFLGREYEIRQLQSIDKADAASIVITYGRRRVGKTELLEQTFQNRHLLKFEGVEGKPEAVQRSLVMQQLSYYTENELLRKVEISNWIDVFNYIYDYTKEGTWTIYFEEVQWLANYGDEFVSQLKYAWDNFFRHNNKIIVILCGSSPAYMINHIVHSKSLYNRSQYEIHLQAFNIIETKALLNIESNRDVMSAYLSVGGIPEYLKRLKTNSSVLLSLCNEAFRKGGSLVNEYEKLFVSSMNSNINYRKVIEFLSKRRFATRDEILKHLKIKTGGRVTELFNDLTLCGFVQCYRPYNLGSNSRTARYCIADNYLQFYYKFIRPIADDINLGRYNNNPVQALNMEQYTQWLGYAFERFCRNNHYIIARILGFSAIQYKSGAYFKRATSENHWGSQIDLVFDRADNVITICEVKYSQKKIGKNIIEDFERKLEYFDNPKGKTIHRVLVAAEGADQSLIDRFYFDEIITLEELFDPHYW